MKLNKKQARTINTAIDLWVRRHVITVELGEMLSDTCEVAGFDWKRLAKYAFWTAILCVILAASAVFADKHVLAMIQKIFGAPAMIISLFTALVAIAFYTHGIRRKRKTPEKHFGNEAVFFLGILSTATAVTFFGKALDLGNGHFSILVLLTAIIYGILGLWFPSKLIWIFSLLSLGGWIGAETGYASGWGAYYLGMNYPLRFVLFGILLTAAAAILPKWDHRKEFSRPTLAMGLLYLFVSLWIMSIFGNYGKSYEWGKAGHIELFHWSLTFGTTAVCAIYFGVRKEDAMLKGFGITFLVLNLYTRFFEYFWNSLHKAVFFAVLAASFWYIGSRAERIWDPGKKLRKKHAKACQKNGGQG